MGKGRGDEKPNLLQKLELFVIGVRGPPDFENNHGESFQGIFCLMGRRKKEKEEKCEVWPKLAR